MNNITSVGSNCCGCGNCYLKCPKKAIKFETNKEGFKYPIIDEKKCIGCGLCQKVCPILANKTVSTENFPKSFAVKNKNIELLKNSSSGGFFSGVALNVLKSNGVVYGSSYDENLNVKHIRINKISELNKIQGSKYVQSDLENIFLSVKNDLNNEKQVLFSGTPCQVSALKIFLNKEYDNLLTCDLVCHGVPSQKIFSKYIEYLEKKYKSKVLSYDFRNKEKKGWGLTAKVIFSNGKIKYINSDFDPYYENFLNCNIYRESCYNCKFANKYRISDFTMADYWGVLSVHNDFYDENGVSLILVNNQKAYDWLMKNQKLFDILDTDFNLAVKKNQNVIKPSSRPLIRNVIYNEIDSSNYVKKNLKVKFKLKKFLKIMFPNKLKKVIKKFLK